MGGRARAPPSPPPPPPPHHTHTHSTHTRAADRAFSDVVGEAKGLGYTEPDPRDDLAGMDVARKVTILAR